MYNLLLNPLAGPDVKLMNSKAEPEAMPHRRLQNREVSRLLSAAVVSPKFKQMVLEQPERALFEGYLGQHFDFDSVDRAILCSGQAETLQELAQALVDRPACQQQEQPRWEQRREASSAQGSRSGEPGLRPEYANVRTGIFE